jgi:hypothetical protein
LFGLIWALLFFITNLGFALGDCVRDQATGQCEGQSSILRRSIIPAELVLLVVVGWIFYRREMKDGEF